MTAVRRDFYRSRGSPQQCVPFWQVCVPRSQPVANGFFPYLIFGHGRDHLVMHEQPVDVECLVACRIVRLELYRSTTFGIAHPSEQCRFEQFRLVF